MASTPTTTTDPGDDPTGSRLANLWCDALEEYEKATKIDLTAGKDQPASIADLLRLVNERKDGHSASIEKKNKFIAAIEHIARAVEAITDVGNAFASQVFPPAAVIFAAIAHLIKSAKHVAAVYESIGKLFDQLKAFLVRTEIYASHELPDTLRQLLLEKLVCLLRILAASTELVSRNRILSVLDQATGGKSDSKLKESIEHMTALSLREDKLVATLNLVASQNHSETLLSVETRLKDVQESLKASNREVPPIDANSVSEKLTRLQTILKPELSVVAEYSGISHGSLENTAAWLLEDRVFQKWLTSPVSLLWISGGPGEGKTHIAARVVSYFRDLCSRTGEADRPSYVGTGFFFCSEENPGRRNFSDIVRTMAFQIAERNASFWEHLCSAVSVVSDAYLGVAHLWDLLFVRFARLHPQEILVLVIDALDEASQEDYEGAETFMNSLAASFREQDGGHIQGLKIILLGRPTVNAFIYELPSSSVVHVDLALRQNADVERYVHSQLQRYRSLRRISTSFQAIVLETLRDKSFLWVKLVCTELSMKTRESQMKDVLRRFPADLMAAIHRIVEVFCEQQDGDVQSDFHSIIALVISTSRPLSLGALDDFLAMESPSGERVLDLESLLRTRYAIFLTLKVMNLSWDHPSYLGRENCPHLRNRIQGGNRQHDDELDANFETDRFCTTVHLSHLAFFEYFKNSRELIPRPVIDPSMAHISLLLLCLSLFCDKDAQGVVTFPFATHYALVDWRWFEHLQNAPIAATSSGSRTRILQYLHLAFTDETSMKAWCDPKQEGYHSSWRKTPLSALASDERIISKILQWLVIEGVELPENTELWIQAVRKDEKALLSPLYNLSARLWLGRTDTWLHPYEFTKFCRFFVERYDVNQGASSAARHVTRVFSDASSSFASSSNIDLSLSRPDFSASPEDIDALALRTGFPGGSPIWHFRLGKTLELLRHSWGFGGAAGVTHYLKAAGSKSFVTDISPKDRCELYLSLGRLYQYDIEDYQNAVVWYLKAVDCSTSSAQSTNILDQAFYNGGLLFARRWKSAPNVEGLANTYRIWERYSTWRLQPGDSWKSSFILFQTASGYICRLREWGEGELAITIMEELTSQVYTARALASSCLVWDLKKVQELGEAVHSICQDYGRLPWMHDMLFFLTSRKYGTKRRHVEVFLQLSCYTAFIQLFVFRADELAIDTLNQILRRLERPTEGGAPYMFQGGKIRGLQARLPFSSIQYDPCAMLYIAAIRTEERGEQPLQLLNSLELMQNAPELCKFPVLERCIRRSGMLFLTLWKWNHREKCRDAISRFIAREIAQLTTPLLLNAPHHPPRDLSVERFWLGMRLEATHWLALVLFKLGDHSGGAALLSSVQSIIRAEVEDRALREIMQGWHEEDGLTPIRCSLPDCDRIPASHASLLEWHNPLRALHGNTEPTSIEPDNMGMGVYICVNPHCVGGVFCPTCFDALQKSDRRSVICSAAHTFVYVSRKNARHLQPGEMIFESDSAGGNSRTVFFRDWIEELRTTWEINDFMMAEYAAETVARRAEESKESVWERWQDEWDNSPNSEDEEDDWRLYDSD